MKQPFALAALAALTVTGAIAAVPAAAQMRAPAFCADLRSYDTDRDGSMDLEEAKAAASTAFDRLNKGKDKEAGVTLKELQGRLSKKEFAEAAHGGKRLSKDDYVAVAEQRFRTADKNNNGAIDCEEIKTKQGKALEHLLK